MTVRDLIGRLRTAGVRLWTDEGKLRWSAPAGAFTTDLRSEVLEHRDEIYALVDRAHTANIDASVRRPPPPTGRHRSLTPNEGRWVWLSTLRPDVPAAHLSVALRWGGRFDVGAIEDAWRRSVRRHSALRVVLGGPIENPVLRMASKPTADTASLKVVRCPVDRDLGETTTRIAREPFDLFEGPLIRATVLQRTLHDHVLLIVAHHVVVDRWSVGLLLSELLSGYVGGSQEVNSDEHLPATAWPSQRSDNRDPLVLTGGGVPGAGEPAYRLCSAAAGSLAWPVRFNAVAFATTRRRTLVDRDHTAIWRSVARREGCTLFVLLLTAFIVTLQRHMRRTESVVGIPIANRPTPDSEHRVGLFADTLVLHIDLTGVRELRDQLARVHEEFVSHYDRRHSSYASIERSLGLGPSCGRAPLARIAFAYQNTPWPKLQIPGLEIAELEVDTGAAPAELGLAVFEQDGGLRAILDHTDDLSERDACALLTEWSACLTRLAD